MQKPFLLLTLIVLVLIGCSFLERNADPLIGADPSGETAERFVKVSENALREKSITFLRSSAGDTPPPNESPPSQPQNKDEMAIDCRQSGCWLWDNVKYRWIWADQTNIK